MSALFLTILNMSITAGWLALAVIAVRLLFRRIPKFVVCLLWALVGIRLVCPFFIESPVSLVPDAKPVPQEILTAPTPHIHTGLNVLNSAVNPVLEESFSPTPVPTTVPTAPAVQPSVVPQTAAPTPMQTAVRIASTVWLVGIAVMLCYMLVSVWRLRRKVREAVPLDKRVFVCDNVASPFILGVFRARIYLPSSLDEADIPYVLAHEQAHLKRRDHIWKPIGFLLLAVYWFHPLLWLAYILLCRDIEQACDEKVIKSLGEQAKKPYSHALVRYSVSRRSIAACPVAFGETNVKSRVRAVLHYKKPTLWILIAALIVSVAVAVGFLTNPKPDTPDTPDTPKATLPTVSAPSDKGTVGALRVTDIIYNCGVYSFIQSAENAPSYHISDDMVLTEFSDGVERTVGTLTPITLNEQTFDARFTVAPMWYDGYSMNDIKHNNRRVWQCYATNVRGIDELYILLEQQDGTMLLGYGYYNMNTTVDNNEDHSHIRWLYLMGKRGGNNTTVTTAQYPAYTVYSSVGGLFDSTLRLSKTDNTFAFLYQSFVTVYSSTDLQYYSPYGRYVLTDDTLTLYTEDDEPSRTFVFRVTANGFAFDAERSSPIITSVMPDGASTLADGTVLSPVATPSLDHTITSASFDIDGDGIVEDCYLRMGPTNGVTSFFFTVCQDGFIEYETLYSNPYWSPQSFTVDENGNTLLCVKAPNETPETYTMTMRISGFDVRLVENGVAPNYLAQSTIR